MKLLLHCPVIASVCALCACTTVTTNVIATQTGINEITHAGSYAFATLPARAQGSAPREAQYENLLDTRLKQLGLSRQSADHARYLLSVAYDTRLATVAVIDGNCQPAHCDMPDNTCSFLHFGRRWEHSLTLRFFDAAGGGEIYKVVASRRDGEADAQRSAPYLVESALAKVPFTANGIFQVKVSANKKGTAPKVLSVDLVKSNDEADKTPQQ
jgi:hypothetical protein